MTEKINTSRPKISFYYKTFIWAYFVLIAFSPLLIKLIKYTRCKCGSVDIKNLLDLSLWSVVNPSIWLNLVWPVFTILIFLYLTYRCSNDRFRFLDGLYYIVAYSNIGWQSMSFVIGFFAVMAAILASIWIAITGEIHRDPKRNKMAYYKLVMFFSRNRLRQ